MEGRPVNQELNPKGEVLQYRVLTAPREAQWLDIMLL